MVLLVLVGVGFALVLLELVVRVAEWRRPVRTEWDDRPRFYFRPKQAPAQQGNVYSREKPAGVFRIAVVGDSISFGPHLQYDDTFSARLARMLNVDRGSPLFEVINYGVPGYATYHEVRKVVQALAEQADLIILQITLNDAELEPLNAAHERHVQRFGAYRPEGWKKGLFAYWRSAGALAERLHNLGTRRAYERYFFGLFDHPASRNKFQESLRTIARLSEEKKTRLIAVVFPLFGFPIDDRYPFTPLHEQIGEWLEGMKIPRLDLLPSFWGIPPERVQAAPGRDQHPNEIAHRIAAEALYRFLFKQEVLPPEVALPRLYTCRTALWEAAAPGGFPSRQARAARNFCMP